MLAHGIWSDTAVTPNRMHPTAGGRRRRGQHSTQGKPAEGRGSPAGLGTEPRGEQKNGRESKLGFNSFLPLSVSVNTSFQSRALNRNSDNEGEHYKKQGIQSRKNPLGCMHALSHRSTIQLLPAALAHLSLALSEHSNSKMLPLYTHCTHFS